MKITRLIVTNVKSPLFEERNEFSFENRTIVYSKKNSIGKTTLIRFILFSMGFKIPSTKHINMGDYETRLFFENNDGSYLAVRHSNGVSIINNEKVIKVFNLQRQDDFDSLLMFVFGLKNALIIGSLLGSFYVDQDNGWEISLKGNTIQYNRFDIIEFISTFINNSILEISQEIEQVNRDISKYNALLKIINIGIEKENKSYLQQESIFDGEYNELKSQQSSLLFNKKKLENSIKKIEDLIADNGNIVENIEQYNIIIKHREDETPFVLKREDVYNYEINNDILIAQLSDYKSQLRLVNEDLSKIRLKLKNAVPLVKAKEVSDNAIEMLRQSNISEGTVSQILIDLKKELIRLKNKKMEIVKSNSNLYSELSSCIHKFLEELGHGDKLAETDILSINAKTLFSGTELHDICLAYTMGCVKYVEDKLGVLLPIVIDSPGSGERVIENLSSLISQVIKSFPNNQIIISTTSEVDLKLFDWVIEAQGFIFEGKYSQYKPE